MQPYEILEQQFGEWHGCNRPGRVAVCSSGTAALHLALETCCLPQNSLVVVPNYTMVACPRAVTLAGLRPFFVGCDTDLQMSARATRELIQGMNTKQRRAEGQTDTIRAIMAVHIYGRRCDMEYFAQLADEFDLFLIEDLAEAHGIGPHKRTDAACWSFYKNKLIHGQEGGAVAFSTQEAADHARSLRNLGFTPAHDYTHIPRGHNYRLANLLATPIIYSLSRYELSNYQAEIIYGLFWKSCPEEWRVPAANAYWVFPIRIQGMTKDQQRFILNNLPADATGARYGFQAMSTQEEYKNAFVYAGFGDALPLSEKLGSEIIYFPLSQATLYHGKGGLFKQVELLLGMARKAFP